MLKFNSTIFLLALLLVVSCNDAKNPNDIRDDINAKEDSLNSNQGSTLEALNKELIKNPNDSYLYYKRALEHQRIKVVDDALADVNRAIGLDSTNADYLLLKAQLLFNKGKGLDAKAIIEKNIGVNPDHINSHLWLAELHLYTNQNIESIKSINNALKVDIYNAKAYYLKGLNYKYVGDTATAVTSFQTAVEQDPDYYDAYMQLGLIYAAAGDPLAVAYYNNAITVNPKSIEAIYNRSLYLQNNNDIEMAKQGYRSISKIDPKYQQSYYNLGYIKLVIEEEYDSAIVFFNKIGRAHV